MMLIKGNFKKDYGKHMIIGVEGTILDQALKDRLNKIKPAGVILFANNIKDPKQLMDFIFEIEVFLFNITNTSPFICIDHEGGRINRLTFEEKIESAWEIGKQDNIELIKDWLYDLNTPIYDLGFNVNFAPCLDVFTNPENKCLEGRCFSDDPEIVADFGEIFINESADMEMMTCAKHFPGLGAAGDDTHEDKVFIDRTEDELLSFELIPFKRAIEADVDFIMVSHAVYPAIDSLPASLSPKIIKGILREKLGYKGYVITDDLCMKGISDYYKQEDAIKMALAAGNDFVLICH
jgi:beta-N-acetylhexosaminidase